MTSKFKVGDKVVFDELNKGVAKEFGYYPNKSYEVINVFPNEETIQIINENGLKNAFAEYRFNLIDNKPSKNQRITALEETVAKQGEEISELKLIVAQIRKPSTIVEEALTAATSVEDIIEFEGAQYKKVDREAREGDVAILREPAEQTPYVKNDTPYKVVRGYNGKPYLIHSTAAYLYHGHFGRTPETVDVYELIVEDKPSADTYLEELPVYGANAKVEKSPNEKRAEIIEKAKLFIEDTKNNTGRLTGRKGYQYPNDDLAFLTDADFVVNADKLTMVVLMRDQMDREIYKKGIAKCMPGDVFNEHIGKAIALGRALGLDVSEFEHAVQPNTLVSGHVIEYTSDDAGTYKGESFTVSNLSDGSIYYTNGEEYNLLSGRDFGIKIINDTNAIYGGGE